MVDHLAALVAELGGDPRGAVGAVGVSVDLAYPGRKAVVGGLAAARSGAVRRQ
ncbi:hypothetical protein OG395_55545 (plasmid) [Streptomyces sp. NBC_01320]|nr:hypothetical protein OG395_55545 [Streptomyces sp. NBC_01320]